MKGIANHLISSFSFLFVLKFGDGSMINKPFDSTIAGFPLDWGAGSQAPGGHSASEGGCGGAADGWSVLRGKYGRRRYNQISTFKTPVFYS